MPNLELVSRFIRVEVAVVAEPDCTSVLCQDPLFGSSPLVLALDEESKTVILIRWITDDLVINPLVKEWLKTDDTFHLG